ncbi:MAG: DapH/DapD/GlmU-related protein [Nibricoccus sp.]
MKNVRPPSLANRLIRRLEHWLAQQRIELIRQQLASCGDNVSFRLPLVINNPDQVRIGNRVSLNAFLHIWAHGGVSIGDDTMIASHVAISSLTHDSAAKRYSDTLISKPVMIGKNVWIGAHAVILPGVTIGDGAIVGAGAVVTRDVAPGITVVGVPAAPLVRT